MPQVPAESTVVQVRQPDGTYAEATAFVRFNDANNSINRWFWSLPAAFNVQLVGYDPETGDVLFDITKSGPEDGDESVPGNWSMVEVTDAGGTWLELPWRVLFRAWTSF